MSADKNRIYELLHSLNLSPRVETNGAQIEANNKQRFTVCHTLSVKSVLYKGPVLLPPQSPPRQNLVCSLDSIRNVLGSSQSSRATCLDQHEACSQPY
jgi:hypothetical protein